MKIICGLGNPGAEYARHRHNVGFMVVDLLAQRMRVSFTQQKFEAELATAAIDGERCLLLKPQTYMNGSGRALGAAARFHKVPTADVLVVHDELDLPYPKLQLKAGGGAGGHNGLSSIAESWGETAFGRLRFGIGKPMGPDARERVVGHVLGNFSSEEAPLLSGALDGAVQMVEAWAKDGMQKAMNRFNRR